MDHQDDGDDDYDTMVLATTYKRWCTSWSTSKGWVGGLDHRKFNIRSQSINETSPYKYTQKPFKSFYVNIFKLLL